MKVFASTKSIQPNKFNSEYEFDGRSFKFYSENKSSTFSENNVYFGVYSNSDVIIKF